MTVEVVLEPPPLTAWRKFLSVSITSTARRRKFTVRRRSGNVFEIIQYDAMGNERGKNSFVAVELREWCEATIRLIDQGATC